MPRTPFFQFSSVARNLLIISVTLTAASGCKDSPEPVDEPHTVAEQPSATVTEKPTVTEQPSVTEDYAYDPTIIAIIGVEVDTKLAALCGVTDNNLFFRYDSSTLLPGAKERLDHIATCLKTGPATGRELIVIGRTDPNGTDEYNNELGMSRADSVAKYLTEAGVAKARVETESKGEAGAVEEPYGWPYDRRVSLRLVD